MRSLYGILLATTNLKNLQKSKELQAENSKINLWAKEQLESKYKVKISKTGKARF